MQKHKGIHERHLCWRESLRFQRKRQKEELPQLYRRKMREITWRDKLMPEGRRTRGAVAGREHPHHGYRPAWAQAGSRGEERQLLPARREGRAPLPGGGCRSARHGSARLSSRRPSALTPRQPRRRPATPGTATTQTLPRHRVSRPAPHRTAPVGEAAAWPAGPPHPPGAAPGPPPPKRRGGRGAARRPPGAAQSRRQAPRAGCGGRRILKTVRSQGSSM